MNYDIEVNLPLYAIPYLTNADSTGLQDDEETLINNWVDDLNHHIGPGNWTIEYPDDIDAERGFVYFPEFGPSTDCVPVIIKSIKE